MVSSDESLRAHSSECVNEYARAPKPHIFAPVRGKNHKPNNITLQILICKKKIGGEQSSDLPEGPELRTLRCYSKEGFIMDEKIKKGIKRLAEDAEIGVARSILRWKYKKEKGIQPSDDDLENQSRRVAGKAHEVIVERGRNIWDEVKKIYAKTGVKEDPDE